MYNLRRRQQAILVIVLKQHQSLCLRLRCVTVTVVSLAYSNCDRQKHRLHYSAIFTHGLFIFSCSFLRPVLKSCVCVPATVLRTVLIFLFWLYFVKVVLIHDSVNKSNVFVMESNVQCWFEFLYFCRTCYRQRG